MSSQLDILALEPFYGGGRRDMLETVIRLSRHRWTLLKLPPRRIERRLTAAAHWFAEQLSRHWVGRVDILFTSEALNLADFYRLMPALLKKPAVVYFHANQLPAANEKRSSPLDLVNLNTAAAAHETWFNSIYHLQDFLQKASSLVLRHSELAAHNPIPVLAEKTQLMFPPVDFGLVHEVGLTPVPRKRKSMFVDTRDADVKLLNDALRLLKKQGEKFELITVGPVEELSPDFPRTTLPENDEIGAIKAMYHCGIYLSTKRSCPCDHRAIRALAAGCWPAVPADGVYPELLPESIHGASMYDGSADDLVNRLQDIWHLDPPQGYQKDLGDILSQYDPIKACRAFDERLEQLATAQVLSK